MAVVVSWIMRARSRMLSASFSLTGGRSNYERTVGEKSSPQWLPRSGALREQKDGATRKAKTNNENVQENRKQRERPDVMNGNRKFCFSRISSLSFPRSSVLTQPSLWKTCEQPPRLFSLFFRDGRRLCTQANTTKFESICFYPFGTTL